MCNKIQKPLVEVEESKGQVEKVKVKGDYNPHIIATTSTNMATATITKTHQIQTHTRHRPQTQILR